MAKTTAKRPAVRRPLDPAKAAARPDAAAGRVSKAARTPRLPAQVSAAVDAARGKKATEITVLDLRKTGAFTDYFLICTGSNPRQVHAIADAIEEALKAKKVRPAHVEGYARAEWILVDYFDFVVHVFSPGARQFYGLERLWGEAARIELPGEGEPVQQARA